MNLIKSTDNEYPYLRILILAVLVKIYETGSAENEKRLGMVKRIVYGARLDGLVKDYGLLREQLGKVVAVQFRKLEVRFEAESYLLNMFNCVPFFDKILLRAFD